MKAKSLMSDLEKIKPKQKHLVFDLVEQCGFNMEDWILSSNDTRGYKANPKYCFEWSFLEPNKVVVLNLWYEALELLDGGVVQRGNFRADAESHAEPGGKEIWNRRASKLDKALQSALGENLPIRVIINTGVRFDPNKPMATGSTVLKRELDSEPWSILEYDWATGQHTIARGIINRNFVDQFDIDQFIKANPEKRERNSFVYNRDPKVRDYVKTRSNGKCEFCGEMGFEMTNGALYVETHHIVPLSEGGIDDASNVIALCPRDHRMAHYSQDASNMREKMHQIVTKVTSSGP